MPGRPLSSSPKMVTTPESAPVFVEVIAARLGLSMVPKEGVKWPDAMEKVKTGEIDVIPKVTPTRDREKFLIFTRPYASFPSVIVTHRDRSSRVLAMF